MVPFSFSLPLLKSRVMKEHLTDALDDGINGFLDNWVHGVDHRPSRWSRVMKTYIVIFGGAWSWESGAFALSYLLAFLMVIPAYAKICEKPNEFAKIQVNPTKSNQIQPHFLFQLLTPDTLIHDT